MHVLFYENEDTTDQVIKSLKSSVHVFDLDPYRMLKTDVKPDNTKTDITPLYSMKKVEYTNYLIHDPSEREKIFGNVHILFTDCLRASVIYRGDYSDIPRDKLVSKKDLEQTPIQGLVDLQEIPFHLRSDKMSELFDTMFVMQALSIIKGNIDIMACIGFTEPIFIIYIVTYYLLLQELHKYENKLNSEEYALLNDIIREVQILYNTINVSIKNKNLNSELKDLKEKYSTLQDENQDYKATLSRLDYIEVIFTNGDTVEKNEQYLRMLLTKNGYPYQLSYIGDNKFTLRLDDVTFMINVYNSLMRFYMDTPNMFIPMFKFNEPNTMVNTQDIYSFTIGGQSTSWAVVFYLLYGPNTEYTKEKDEAVRSLIKLSETTGIPLNLLLPK